MSQLLEKKKQKKNFRSLKCLWCVLAIKGCIKYSKKDLVLKKKKWRIEIQGLLNIHSKPFGLAIRSYLALKRIKPKKSKLQVSNQLIPTHCSVFDTYLWIWFESLNAYDWNKETLNLIFFEISWQIKGYRIGV